MGNKTVYSTVDARNDEGSYMPRCAHNLVFCTLAAYQFLIAHAYCVILKVVLC